MLTQISFTDILRAASSSIIKTFLIASVGYLSTKYPLSKPYLTPSDINSLSRFSFTFLFLPLIYSGIPSSINLKGVNSYWFVIPGAILVITISFGISSLMMHIPIFTNYKSIHCCKVLQTSIVFPNIIALPILIFPELCHYKGIYETFCEQLWPSATNVEEKQKSCVSVMNTMVFLYFFGWSVLFWSFGYKLLVESGRELEEKVIQNKRIKIKIRQNRICFQNCRIMTQPGFIALILGTLTTCIEPLRISLFQKGRSLSFVGSCLKDLGTSGATLATIIVAANLSLSTNYELIPLCVQKLNSTHTRGIMENKDTMIFSLVNYGKKKLMNISNYDIPKAKCHTSPNRLIPYSIETKKSLLLTKTCFQKKHPTSAIIVWYITCRLLLTPALICGLILFFEKKTNILDSIPSLVKPLLLVNSAVPGALVLIVVLKAEGCSKSASFLSKVYLPCYLISIFTVTAWASVGVWMSIPKM